MTIFGFPQEMIDEERNYLDSFKEAEVKKECLHNFETVYYGELDYECSKCQKSIWDIYTIEDANKLLNKLNLNDNKEHNKRKSSNSLVEWWRNKCRNL